MSEVRNGQYEAKLEREERVVPSPDLESALAKLRGCADMTMFVEVNHNEAAALLAKIEAADRLAGGVETTNRLRIAGAYGYVSDKVSDAIISLDLLSSAYRNPQPAFSCASCGHQWSDDAIWCPKCKVGYRNPQPAGGGEKSGEFAPAPPDKTYQHALVRRLWEAQLGDLPDDVKRLMAEAATEIEGNLPATDDFVNSMRRKHTKVIQ